VAIWRVCEGIQSTYVYIWLLVEGNGGELEVKLEGAPIVGETIKVFDGTQEIGSITKVESCWRHLVENPMDWWDNQVMQKNPQVPNFKYKTTRRALWINNWQTPNWAKTRFQD